MQIDIRGKINEKRLGFNNTLLPLFEAVVNSIHAIEEDSSTKPGIIQIHLIRTPQKDIEFPEENVLTPILDFKIIDNGIGFTERNYQSFNFAHSTYKEKKGGKGIGRFAWLRAFAKAEIQSQYKEGNKWYFRKFNFEPTVQGIEKHEQKDLNGSKNLSRQTEVCLKGLKEEYQKWCNVNAEDIALKIIEHCFIYFLNKDCPIIKLIDEDFEIIVNDYFGLFTKGQVKSEPIKIRNQSFQLNLVKLYNNKLDNKIHYCAHTREVQSERLNSSIPDLDGFLTDEEGAKFSIAVYVTGDYLDDNVNEERTVIRFAKREDGDIVYPDEITIDELTNEIAQKVQKYYTKYLSELGNIRYQKVKLFVQQHPRYRQLLKYRIDEVKRIPSNLSEEKMELELFKIQQSLDLEVKKEANDILKFITSLNDKEDFSTKFNELYNKIIEVGNSKLSEYIIHRKLVLDLLGKHLKPNDGKFSKEEAVHQLIFPLKQLSDDLGFEDHNLWVIDERLSYHKYLASDKKFKHMKELNSKSNDKPDIIVFNKPFAFTNDDKPYTSIVLIEFKRPMRDDYTEKENPISQVNRYAREICENEVLDKSDRTLDLRPNTPIYAYIVSDLTKNLRQFAKDAGYKPLPDNDGFFSYNDNYNLYIEIISFDKLLRDSEQRNKVLFDKLNLSSI